MAWSRTFRRWKDGPYRPSWDRQVNVNGNGDEEHAKQLTNRLFAGYKVVNMLLNLNAKDSGNEKLVVLMEKS